MIRPLIWLIAWVRALTAERLATCRDRMDSTSPSLAFGTALARPAATARAAE